MNFIKIAWMNMDDNPWVNNAFRKQEHDRF